MVNPRGRVNDFRERAQQVRTNAQLGHSFFTGLQAIAKKRILSFNNHDHTANEIKSGRVCFGQIDHSQEHREPDFSWASSLERRIEHGSCASGRLGPRSVMML